MGRSILGAAVVTVTSAFLDLGRSLFTRRRADDSFIPTGLKAVDLFAPLPRGGDIVITGGDGTGSTVLGYEIAHRLLRHPAEEFSVLFLLDEGLRDLEIRTAEMGELLPFLTNLLVVANVSEEQLLRYVATSQHTVVFVVSHDARFLEISREAIRRVRENSKGRNSLTTVTMNGGSNAFEYDAQIACCRMIAKQGIYPAIDPYTSHSSVYSDPTALRRQKKTADRAVEMIHELMQRLYEGAVQDPAWIYNHNAAHRPSLQALCFMSQPLFTAEAYTGRKASYVPIASTVDAFELILTGRKNETPTRTFMYTDSLPQG